MTESEIVDPCRISFHVVGRWPDGMIFIKSLNPQRIWGDLYDFEVQATLHYLCAKAVNSAIPDEPAVLVGVIRTQQEGDEVARYHTFIPPFRHRGEYNPSPEDDLTMANALLHIIAAERNPENPRREAERIAEDVAVYEGLGLGGENA